MRKYRNDVIQTEDGRFDSRREYKRWCELKLLQRAKVIQDLRRQVSFTLIPAQKDKDTGKVVERECKYVADFVYTMDGKTVVEDTKGMKTPEYIIKRKLMLEKHGIKIEEV